jgi:hypothetical protein
MLCHDMQPNGVLIWQHFITTKEWVLHIPCYAYLKLKIPGPVGVITVEAKA